MGIADASDISELRTAVKGQDIVYSAVSGPQLPNRRAADLIEASDLEYTILRPGIMETVKLNNGVEMP